MMVANLAFKHELTFETSSESLIRGWLFISTSLKTQPRAAWEKHVTRYVPIPKASTSCPCTKYQISSHGMCWSHGVKIFIADGHHTSLS